VSRFGGARGNERLTLLAALVLLALLGVELLTTLGLPAYLSVHLFVGIVLIPLVSLKLASTSWRFARYYTGSAEYRRLGPPQIVLRALAPALVVATVVLFGSGVAFLAVTGTHPLRTIHTFAFLAWGVLMVVHVFAYLKRVLWGALADWRPQRRLDGGGLRLGLVAGSLVAGLVVAGATYSVQQSWLAHHDRHGEGGRTAPATRLQPRAKELSAARSRGLPLAGTNVSRLP
jgi:hypothetical protein